MTLYNDIDEGADTATRLAVAIRKPPNQTEATPMTEGNP